MRYTTEREMEGDSDEKGAKRHVRHKMSPPCHITTGINTTTHLIVSSPEKKSSHFFFLILCGDCRTTPAENLKRW